MAVKTKDKTSYLSILIWPVLTLYTSLKYFRRPEAKNLFWLFCIFLGLIHIYSPEEGREVDGTRYAQQLIKLNQQPISWENFSSSFYEEGEFVDIYQPIITYLLSIITNDPRWLFFVFAIVFGFFYSRNIWFVLEKFPKIIKYPLILLTFYYILICPIWNINGVRMWTALHVFVYGALPYLYNANKSKLVWCFASLLIHFSFFLPVIILLLYRFIPKSINFLLVFYLVSLFIAEINLEQIRNILTPLVPSFLTPRVEGYTNELYAQNIIDAKSNLNFYVEGSKETVKWIITSLLFASCIWGKEIIKTHKAVSNLLCFSLFIYAISNILLFIPSFGRFIVLSQMFAFASMILFYIMFIQSKQKQKYIVYSFRLIPIVLLFPIIVILRMGCDYYGISLFLNPTIALFIEDNQPIIHLIKSFF